MLLMNLTMHHPAFSEFIHERESNPATSPQIKLFDEVITCKRNRGGSSRFSKNTLTPLIADTTDHIWRTAAAPSTSTRSVSGGSGSGVGAGKPGQSFVGRMPAKLDKSLMREPRVVQGVPVAVGKEKVRRKLVPSMLGLQGRNGSDGAVMTFGGL